MSSRSTDAAIEVRGVSKQYNYGAGAPGRLAEALKQGFHFATKSHMRLERRKIFWALRNVSLQVHAGEVVGVIGRNGSGKSTLLKLLARITAPTTGEIMMRGRVASLLEVGAGFDPELSGRENVFLTGAILGMRRAEILDKFEEIVAFSGIGNFIDTPVKRYSSGMFVRLAFAVGAHLDSDILLIDEVLAVGDMEFQRKCLGKLGSEASHGRTVVFVSHNLGAVQGLCPRAFLLDAGQLVSEGKTSDVIGAYLDLVGGHQDGGEVNVSKLVRPGNGLARLQRVALLGRDGQRTNFLHFGDPLAALLTYEVHEPVHEAVFQVSVSTADGLRVITAHNTDAGGKMFYLAPGVHFLRVTLDAEIFPGDFLLDAALIQRNGVPIDHLDGALHFRVVNLVEGTGPYPLADMRGVVRPASRWECVPASVSVNT